MTSVDSGFTKSRTYGSLESVTSRLVIYRAFESARRESSPAGRGSREIRRIVSKLRNKFSGAGRGGAQLGNEAQRIGVVVKYFADARAFATDLQTTVRT